MPSPCRSPVSRKIAAASWWAVIASSNRRTSRSARPRLFSAMPSPCRSPVSRKIAAASWCAVIASSNRRTSRSAQAEVVQRRGFVAPVAQAACGIAADRQDWPASHRTAAARPSTRPGQAAELMATWSRPVLAAMVTAATRLGRSASSHARASSRPVKSAGTGAPGSARR